MDLTKPVINHLIFPLMERLKHNRIRLYAKQLRESQSLPPQKLAQLQRKRLQKLLAHCLSHVPAYALPETDEFQLNRLWGRIPPLSRETFQKNRDSYLADNCQKENLIENSSGGSTGQPVFFWLDRFTVEHYEAARFRGLSWWGLTPGSRSVMVWGNPQETNQLKSWKTQRRERFLKNRRVIPAFDLTPERLPEHVRLLNRFHPEFIYGYPSAIYTLARQIRHAGLSLSFRPKLVLSTSEMLYDDQRELISQAFGCPVANEYGARDAGILAFECPHGSLHITSENALLEVLDPVTLMPKPPGETGLLAVTDLHNYVCPRLRYLLGDMASLSDTPCACGMTLPVLKSLDGRHVDMFLLPDGRFVNGHAFGVLFLKLEREKPAIEQFQIIQHTPERATLRLIRREGASAERVRLFQSHLADMLPGVKITTQFVSGIPASASGKTRYSIREFDPGAYVPKTMPDDVSEALPDDAPERP